MFFLNLAYSNRRKPPWFRHSDTSNMKYKNTKQLVKNRKISSHYGLDKVPLHYYAKRLHLWIYHILTIENILSQSLIQIFK